VRNRRSFFPHQDENSKSLTQHPISLLLKGKKIVKRNEHNLQNGMKKRLVHENSSFQIIALFILQNSNKGRTVKYSNIVHEID